MLIHCNSKFRPKETLFLSDNMLFTNRKIETGVCPICEKLLVRLVEKRILDDEIFDNTYTGFKAEKVLKKYEDEILYTSLNCIKQKGLFGYRYGINTQRTDKNSGDITVIQKACDFFGNKEIVKKFKI